MSTFDFDLFVIGGGSGGVRAARMSAQRGVRVALAEAQAAGGGLGGTCVNAGCIPKKLYSYAAHYGHGFHEADGFGWEQDAPARLNWETLKHNRRTEISRLNGVYEKMLVNNGVQLISGYARPLDAHSVEVDIWQDGTLTRKRMTAKNILIAVGGQPWIPDIPGAELCISSNEIFDLETFPERLLVVGGGYIASEFASIFSGLGSQVIQLYRGSQILRGFDDEVRDFVAAEMRKSGVDLRVQADVASIARGADGLMVTLKDGEQVQVDTVLYATGRVPNVEGLNLAQAGIAQAKDSSIVVDDCYRTNVPSIFAVGDVINRLQLTPVALGEAMVVVDQLFGPAAGKPPRSMSYEFVPTAVFTHPNIGTVGFSEEQAREEFGAISVFRSEFKALKHTLSGSSERTLMKLIVDDATDRVVGLHMVGAEAGEIVQGFAVAMKAGATKAVFDSTIGIHPTAAEEFVTMREPVTARS
jgi:glutathione reductase (NADPH)